MDKERLRKYRAIVAEKRQLELMLEEVEVSVYSPRIPQITGMPSAHNSKSGSVQERAADSTEHLRAFYREKIEELHKEQLEIELAIDGLEPMFRELLRHKYIEGRTWAQISEIMHYGERQLKRLHKRALRQLQ